MVTPMGSIAERVKELREIAGLTPRALSILAGLNQSHVRLVESGERGSNLGYETVHALARTLGASVEWLGSGEGEGPAPEHVRAAVEAARVARPAIEAARALKAVA